MKTKLFAGMIIIALAWFAQESLAKRSTSLLMTRTGYEQTEEETGRHTPTRPLECIIDESLGIIFSTEPSPEILSYEINDANGNCVAVFGDEEPFVEFLFTLSGEYQLRFTTSTYNLIGYIKL